MHPNPLPLDLVLAGVNAQRRSVGLPPLTHDDLVRAALKRGLQLTDAGLVCGGAEYQELVRDLAEA